MRTNIISLFIRKPGRSCLKACMSFYLLPGCLPPQHFTLCCGSLKMTQKLCTGHSLRWERLSISLNSLIVSLEIFYFSPQNLRPHFSRSLPRPPPCPHFTPEGVTFAFAPWVCLHCWIYTLATYWHCVCPHDCTVNYSSLPGDLELLNKCLWNEYRNDSLLFFILLHILQGSAQMSPPLGSFPGLPSRVELIMSSMFP